MTLLCFAREKPAVGSNPGTAAQDGCSLHHGNSRVTGRGQFSHRATGELLGGPQERASFVLHREGKEQWGLGPGSHSGIWLLLEAESRLALRTAQNLRTK